MLACVLLLCLIAVVLGSGGYEIRDPSTGAKAKLTYANSSVILQYTEPTATAVCPGSENPLTIKQNLTSPDCPTYLVGVNQDDPQCNLDAKGSLCAEDVQISNSITLGACDIGVRVCQTPLNRLVPLQSVLSPAVDESDYTLTSEPLRTGAQFGHSVDVNSTFILSGAPTGVSLLWPSLVTGAAYLFQSYISFVNTSFNSLRWVQTQSLSPFSTSTSTEVDDCQFGHVTRMLNAPNNALEFVAAGAPNSRIGGNNRGAAYIFRNIGSVINIDGNIFPLVDPLQRIDSPAPVNGAQFGHSIEFGLFKDGTKHLFIGAPFDRDVNNQQNAGCVYWFYWNNVGGTWDGGTKISCIFAGAASTTQGSKCGWSISFAQDPDGLAMLAVGAPEYQRSGGLADAGSVTLFYWDTNTLLWTQVGGDIPDVGDSFYGTTYQFGFDVRLSGNAQWLFVGTPGATTNGTSDVGVVVTYEQVSINSSSYVQYRQPIQIPVSLEGSSPDLFGYALDTNWDSDLLLVCAPGFGLDVVPNSGVCFRFEYSAGSGYWNDTFQVIKGEVPQSNSLFGYSVAVDSTQLVIGSPGYSLGPIDNGIVSVNYDLTSLSFVRNTTCIQERGVLSNVLTFSCSFVLLRNIPPGFYKVTTNTSALMIPSTEIQFVQYSFTDIGETYLDAYYTIKYFNPNIPQEDIFVFYMLSRTHTAVTVTMISKVYLY